MRLKLASRKSDLARWQAVEVGRLLEKLPDKPSIEFLFKSSLGDQNLDLPLASMGSKGVFTEDFYEDLRSGVCDLVVHSWKDLPTEERAETKVAMTLPRADVRDVLLVPDAVWNQVLRTGELKILTSSPRRIYNLSHALPSLLPQINGRQVKVVFENVRGNVPTRLKKMHDLGCALALAKAGLDRLLQAEGEGFLSPDTQIRSLVSHCRFMVLPVSLNPPAPAQGALAIEILRDNLAFSEILQSINDQECFSDVVCEREILKSYGGGCHQKIGAAVLKRSFGQVFALRGLTYENVELNDWRIEDGKTWERTTPEKVFPLKPEDNRWFHREPLSVSNQYLEQQPGLFIARAEALPETYHPHLGQMIWTAGVQTWIRLAEKAIWVNGTQDGLGEMEPLRLEWLSESPKWAKLTHSRSESNSEVGWQDTVIATYKLNERTEAPNLTGKTHFFWMSGTTFDRAKELYPEQILKGKHACGPGNTFTHLRKHGIHAKVFVGLEQFLAESIS